MFINSVCLRLLTFAYETCLVYKPSVLVTEQPLLTVCSRTPTPHRDDDELEMLVILRMNRDFMQFMRKHFNHLTKDHFGKTTVDED